MVRAERAFCSLMPCIMHADIGMHTLATLTSSTVDRHLRLHERSMENEKEKEFYMRQALQVAREALAVGEVPVGCVIVQSLENGESVVVSHGANQVNATRDATRHAEMVAIDRMLTRGKSSDQLRLPPSLVAKAAHGAIPADSPLQQSPNNVMNDKWINVLENPSHWKNEYGWGSGKLYTVDSFSTCDLYVTCEPCIMVSRKYCIMVS